MKRTIAILIAFLAASCATPRPKPAPTPPVPATYTLFVHACTGQPCEVGNEPYKLPGAQVTITTNGTDYVEVADGAGNLIVGNLVAATRHVCASAPSYVAACADVTLPRAEGQDVFLVLKADLPPVPTRDELLHLHETFQGLSCTTSQWGTLPIFDPAIAWFDDPADRAACYAAKVAAGDETVILTISGAYNEAGQAYWHIPGKDWTQDLPTLRARIVEALTVGHMRGVRLWLAGDGLSAPKRPDGSYPYNDPVGWTYGYQWLTDNFPRIYASLAGRGGEGPDLTPYIVWFAGADGWIPGWAGPDNQWHRVSDWLLFARSVVGPDGKLGVYLSAGYWAWSGEHNDYADPAGQQVDFVALEFPYPMGPPDDAPPADFCNAGDARYRWDQVWQIAKRTLGPLYHRPADQPACDDGGVAPALPLTPRGAIAVEATEFDTYGTVRGESAATTARRRAYLRALGFPLVG